MSKRKKYVIASADATKYYVENHFGKKSEARRFKTYEQAERTAETHNWDKGRIMPVNDGEMPIEHEYRIDFILEERGASPKMKSFTVKAFTPAQAMRELKASLSESEEISRVMQMLEDGEPVRDHWSTKNDGNKEKIVSYTAEQIIEHIKNARSRNAILDIEGEIEHLAENQDNKKIEEMMKMMKRKKRELGVRDAVNDALGIRTYVDDFTVDEEEQSASMYVTIQTDAGTAYYETKVDALGNAEELTLRDEHFGDITLEDAAEKLQLSDDELYALIRKLEKNAADALKKKLEKRSRARDDWQSLYIPPKRIGKLIVDAYDIDIEKSVGMIYVAKDVDENVPGVLVEFEMIDERSADEPVMCGDWTLLDDETEKEIEFDDACKHLDCTEHELHAALRELEAMTERCAQVEYPIKARNYDSKPSKTRKFIVRAESKDEAIEKVKRHLAKESKMRDDLPFFEAQSFDKLTIETSDISKAECDGIISASQRRYVFAIFKVHEEAAPGEIMLYLDEHELRDDNKLITVDEACKILRCDKNELQDAIEELKLMLERQLQTKYQEIRD